MCVPVPSLLIIKKLNNVNVLVLNNGDCIIMLAQDVTVMYCESSSRLRWILRILRKGSLLCNVLRFRGAWYAGGKVCVVNYAVLGNLCHNLGISLHVCLLEFFSIVTIELWMKG